MKKSIDFTDLLIEQTSHLIHETQAYIQWRAPLDLANLSRKDVVKLSVEIMRVTVRLTQVMGWLLLQKAIAEGEVSRDTILSANVHVLHGVGCLETASEEDETLPSRLRELLKESHHLYVRTWRLENLSLYPSHLPEEIKEKRAKRALV